MSSEIRKNIDFLISKKENLIREKQVKKKKMIQVKKNIINYKKARNVLLEVSEKTQNKIKIKIEEIITLALRSVFDEEFVFVLKFLQKRNRVEAVPTIKIGDEEFDPKDELGGAIIDIISFVFRPILWGMTKEKTRPIFILDEPFRFTGSLVKKAGEMVKFLSKELGLQIIIISHDRRLIKFCDQVYKVKKIRNKSFVRKIKSAEPIKEVKNEKS